LTTRGERDPHHSYTVQQKVDPTQTNQGQMSKPSVIQYLLRWQRTSGRPLTHPHIVSMFLCSLVL
jgi:hypothetical protein